MPAYHYACEKCEHEFELEQKISDPPRKRCPKGRGAVYRVIYPVGPILKGSGFYKTDYRGEDYKKKELAEKKSDLPTEEKKEKKTEKKTTGKSQ